jgi:hypothetical protein
LKVMRSGAMLSAESYIKFRRVVRENFRSKSGIHHL